MEPHPTLQGLTGFPRLLAGEYDILDWDETAGLRQLPLYVEPTIPNPPAYLVPPTGDDLTALRPTEAQRPTHAGLIVAHLTIMGVLASFVGDLENKESELPRLACYVLMFGHGTFGLLGLCWWLFASNGWFLAG